MNKEEKIKIILERHPKYRNCSITKDLLPKLNIEYCITNNSTKTSKLYLEYNDKKSPNVNLDIINNYSEQYKTLMKSKKNLESKLLDFSIILIIPYTDFNVNFVNNHIPMGFLYTDLTDPLEIGFFHPTSKRLIYKSDYDGGIMDFSSGFIDEKD
ncbi:MAG: hypothetical protein N4A35_06620 [Flavobacteriales bacterium]|jgi:hypothetical protein|nr:hypothetical protein [Flavobacteriales bacterium]